MAGETNLYKFDGTKYVAVPQTSGAAQQALVDNTGGSTADVTLAVVPYGAGAFYLSAVGSAVAAGAAYAVFPAADATTVAIETSNFTHTSPGRLTYTGTPTAGVHILVTGTVALALANEQITFNIRKNGTTVSAGFAKVVEVDAPNDTVAFTILADVDLSTNNYIEVEVKSDGTSVNVTPLTLVMHAYVSDSFEDGVVANNFAKIARLVNTIRQTLVDAAIMKGGA